MKAAHLVILLGLVAPASALAGEWYVDASAVAGGDGSAARPFAVIQDAVNAAGAGDAIHVAAGVYSNGVTTVSGGNSRICVTNLPSLKFVGAGRGKTVVVGSRDPAEEAFGSTEVPVRCAYVADSDGTIFTGFTFRDGEIQNGKESLSAGNAGGGLYADSAEVYLVDCDIVHCSARHGAPAYQGTLVRCLVDNSYGLMGPGGRNVRYINSVITRSQIADSSKATLYECKLYNATVIDNDSTWAVQTSDDEIYNSLLLLSSNTDIYRETNKVCRVENSVLSHTASKSFWQVMGPLAGDWRLLNDSDAINAGVSSWLTCLSLPNGIDAFKDFAGNTIVPDAQGRINAGAIQTVVTPAGGALVFKAPQKVFVDGYAMCRAVDANIGWIFPETYPTQFCVRANLEDGETLYRIMRFDAAGNSYANVTEPGFVPRDEGGAMCLLPPPSRTVNSTNQIVAAATVLWCDDDAYGQADADGSEAHPYGTIQAALDAVVTNTPTVIFVKPGTYSNDTTTSSAYGTFRVFGNNANHHVRIASTDGADKTFVVGKPDDSTLESETNPGCGAAAVKGLGLIGQNYVVQGLTVCGCYGPTDGASSAKEGSAFVTDDKKPALVVDCVISNNVSADSVCESGFYRRCVFRGNTSYMQTVSGAYVASSFLANNDVTVTGSGAYGPLTGTVGAYNLTLVGTVRNGRLYSGSVPHFNTIFDGGGSVFSACRATNSIAYNYKNKYGTESYILQDPRFVARETSPAVKTDSPAVGAGLVPTADNYGADYWKAMDGDLYGNPIAFSASGAPTIGAAQVPAAFVTITFATPVNGGLATADGATSGTFELSEGTADSVSFVPADGTRPCAGLAIGGTSYWFTNTADNVITLGYSALSSCGATCAVEPIYTTDWYVDDDGDDSRSGMLPSLARKTLISAMSLCASGDTLWALPGTYDEGAEKANSKHTVSNRVIVSAGVTLRSTEGPAVTFIVGAEAPTETRDDYGCGTNAVRCVYLAGSNAKVIGFTLKDGRTNLDSSTEVDQHGGGVLGYSSSDGRISSKGYWVVDCLITNCVARNGAAVSRACLVRSKALGNTAVQNLIYQGSAYGSYIDHSVVANAVFDYCLDIVGSTVGPDNLTPAGKVTSVAKHSIGKGGVFVNTLFCNPITPGGSDTTVIRNCVCAKGSDLSEHADTNETVLVATDDAQVAIDANGAPVLGSTLAVDAGDTSWYAEGTYPTLDAVTDLAGGQRVYNGRMDVGCNEADWRGRYATDLGRRRPLTVTRADPAVVETAAGVAISNGVLNVLWTNDRETDAQYSFVAQVTGTGTLTVTLNGDAFRTLTAADGQMTLNFASESETQTLGFAYAAGADDTGAAILSHFRRAGRGLVLLIK